MPKRNSDYKNQTKKKKKKNIQTFFNREIYIYL